jgi:protein-S-isoprenylcysteine O-methyltransferase
MLLAFLGVGVYFGNWLSVLAIMLPITLATIHRITVEEAALTRKLGAAYEAYCSRTKRLVPGVY